MATYKAKSIVLKSYRLGEVDKIIKLFSIEHGMISAVAKGAYNFKSRFSGRLELYNVIDCEMSEGKNLDIVSQAEIIEVFNNISSDFYKFGVSQSISEIILKTQSEKSPSEIIFHLLYVVLRQINKCNPQDNTTCKKTLLFFIARFLKIMGYVPLFDSCSICGSKLDDKKAVSDTGNLIFSISYGGMICKTCSGNIAGLLLIEKECAEILINLFSSKIEYIISLRISDKNMGKLTYILEKYFLYHMDTNIESFDYLEKIEK
ncbi:MAG: DNA repair protein RecO [Actinomycetota bacterium]|nr:DNA repair protein RecO [Actinomycetota bacterium]